MSDPVETRAIEIPEHLKAAVEDIMKPLRGTIVPAIADQFMVAGVEPLIAANLAIHVLRTDCARYAVLAAHAFGKREPRRDWWMQGAAEDFDAAVKWYAAVSAELDADEERCIACDEVIEDGEPIYNDQDGGLIHAACCGPDRASYCGPDGEPLQPGEPIPEPYLYRKEPDNA